MPNSKIYLLNCNITSDNKNQVDFASLTAQTSFWTSKASSDMTAAGLSTMYNLNYTWTPRSNTVQIGTNINNLFTFNYCMILNNFNNKEKWFYYFINSKTYINDNVTELYLAIDVFQTYMFDYSIKPSMVIREHCNIEDDTYLNNLIDEPVEFDTEQFVPIAIKLLNDFTPYCVVMGVNGAINTDSLVIQDIGEAPSPPLSPVFPDVPDTTSYTTLQNDVSGLSYYIFDMGFIGGVKPLFDILEKNASALDRIISLVAVPRYMFNIPSTPPTFPNTTGTYYGAKFWGLIRDIPSYRSMASHNVNMALDPETLNIPSPSGANYIPKNKKLLHAPFYQLCVKSFTGQTQKFDFAHLNATNQTFIINAFGVNGGYAVLYPQQYYSLNATSDRDSIMSLYGLNVSSSYQIPITHDSFNAYMQTQFAADITNIALGAITGGILGSGGKSALAGALKGGSGLPQNFLNTAKGNGAHNVTNTSAFAPMGLNTPVYIFYIECITYESAVTLDEYFELYGYATKRLKIPNTNNRPYWNYVEVENIHLVANTNNIPQAHINELKAIYQNGVTIWHDYNEMFDYSNNNHSTTALQERQNNV